MEDWRKLSDEQIVEFEHGLAEQLASQGISSCPDADPGTLAQRLDNRVVQRDHLVKIDEAFREIDSGATDRLLITTPPQIGKSDRSGVWAPFWWLAKHPRDNVVLASYGQHLANARGRSVRGLVEEHGAPLGLRLDPRTTAVDNWKLTTNGGMRCVGVGAGLTGFPASIAIVDDPHKDRAEAESPTIRQAIHEWWSSTLISRLAPRAPVALVMTLWHPDDLAGRLLRDEGRIEEGGRWKVIELPAFATDHLTDESGARLCSCPEDQAHDALGRAPGAPLSHPKIDPSDIAGATAHWEDKRRSSSVRDWHALYQCNPVPTEGALVSADLLRVQRHYDNVAAPVRSGVAIDPSGGGRDSCGIIGGHLGVDRRAWWTHDRSGVMPSDAWGRAACLLAFEIDADVFIIEKNYGGDQARTILRLSWDALRLEGRVSGLVPRLVEVHAKKNKVLRAEPVAQALVEDRVRIGKPLPDVEGEWFTYQLDSPTSPGRIDASVYLTMELLPDAGSEVKIGVPRGSRNAPPTPHSAIATSRVHRPMLGRGRSAYDGVAHLRVVRDEEAS